MRGLSRTSMYCVAALLAAAPSAQAQQTPLGQQPPHLGYVYPAGGQQGTSFEVTVGGQYLSGVTGAHLSGEGVQVTVGKYTRPLTPQEINRLREKLQELQKQRREKGGRASGGFAEFLKVAKEMGVTEEQIKGLQDFQKSRNDPKKQVFPQIAEKVTLQIKLAPDAPPGPRELRLITPAGLSNPLRFCVGQLREARESEPNDKTPDSSIGDKLPVVINGQITPGDVDRFAFKARKGAKLVVAASARELIPYLADAVPGWFQATLTLYDPKGHEVAYADAFRSQPDPVLCYEVPEDGQYVLEVRDAIYRGRDDFVYRITVGELPFVTSIFPLGGPAGAQTAVELKGWNLPLAGVTQDAAKQSGICPLSLPKEARVLNQVPFAVDALPEILEQEPNNNPATAQRVTLPVIVNGRIGQPGDADVFRFEGRAGNQIVAEVHARRLNSPLDSTLRLTDATGRQLAFNDDFEDKGSGLNTHHADSLLRATLPSDGTYYLHLGDAQHKGGPEFGYRLRISEPRPDFELRVTPASITARAGMSIPITVYALRKDGFAGEIALGLKNAPAGFTLSGGRVPAGQDQARLTLTAPPMPPKQPVPVQLEGRAMVDTREVSRGAVPAEDMMQAFAYHHLVPAEEWIVAVVGGGRFRGSPKLVGSPSVKLPAGGTAEVRLAVPASPLMAQLRLELSEPPEGVAIQKVSTGEANVVIQFRADAEKVKPGLKGNLIVDAFWQPTAAASDKRPAANRRMPLGALPAIPFEIVGR